MPGIYRLPRTGKDAIELNGWTNTVIRAARVTIIFEELPKTPITLNRCDHVTLEGATLLFAEPSFTQGRITAMGQDGRGKYLDWQIDAGYPIFDPSKSCFDVVDQHTRLLKFGTGDLGCERGGITRQGPLSVEGHQWPAWFRNGQRLALYPSARWRWLDCPPRRLQPLHAAGNHSAECRLCGIF